MKRSDVPDSDAEILRQAEASSRLEGIDTCSNVFLNEHKPQILAGEISIDEALQAYAEDIQKRLE